MAAVSVAITIKLVTYDHSFLKLNFLKLAHGQEVLVYPTETFALLQV